MQLQPAVDTLFRYGHTCRAATTVAPTYVALRMPTTQITETWGIACCFGSDSDTGQSSCPAQLVREQAEYRNGGVSADINFAIRNCRHSEFYSETCDAGSAARTAVKQVGDVGRVIGIEDSVAARRPGTQVQDPNHAVGGAAGGDGWRRAARRERIGGFRGLRCGNNPICNGELAEGVVLSGGVDVAVPVGRQTVDATVELSGVGRRNRDYLLHVIVG